MVAGTWLDHKQLMIIKGIGKTPGDIYSAENDPVIVNLMSDIISLEVNGWSPEIAQVKAGGVWADSPLSDGRELLAAAAGNVIEKMSVIITDNSYLGAIKALSGLNDMADDCRDYWQSEYQIDPVYLAWWAGCGVGLQYALLSNIEVSPDYLDSPKPTIRASITLEREPYWRGIPPGANPKIWTYYVNSAHPQFNFNVASLVTGSDHLVSQSIVNRFEWNPTAYGLQTTPLVTAGQSDQNWIDISADKVPGDAPALVEMSVYSTNSILANLYIGRSSKRFLNTGHDGVTRGSALNLNGGDGNNTGVGLKTTPTGLISNGSLVTAYRVVRTVTGADANFVTVSQWGSNSPASGIKLDRELYRGSFAVFCRCCNNSVTPVLTDMSIRLFVEEFEDSAANQAINSVTLPEATPPLSQPGLVYMGTLTLPFENRAVQSPLGYGIQLQNANSNLRISLQQKVLVATANRILDFYDLILIPIDECMAQVAVSYSTASSLGIALLDNTGYLMRGEANQIATMYITNADSGGVGQEVRGQDITLTPKTAQRLYFISDGWFTSTALSSVIQTTFEVRLNIVPRWAGIRDV